MVRLKFDDDNIQNNVKAATHATNVYSFVEAFSNSPFAPNIFDYI